MNKVIYLSSVFVILISCTNSGNMITFEKIKISDPNWLNLSKLDISYARPIDWKEIVDSTLNQLTIYKQTQNDSTNSDYLLKITESIKVYHLNGQSFDDNFKYQTELLKKQLGVTGFKIKKVFLSDSRGYCLSAKVSSEAGMDSTLIYILDGRDSDYIILRHGLTKYRSEGDSVLRSLILY